MFARQAAQGQRLKVAPLKMEGYLNIDSGTLNPYRHGEVFVLDDGMECDMDLGTYERMLDQDLTRSNYATSGPDLPAGAGQGAHGGYFGPGRADDPARDRRGEIHAPRTGDEAGRGPWCSWRWRDGRRL